MAAYVHCNYPGSSYSWGGGKGSGGGEERGRVVRSIVDGLERGRTEERLVYFAITTEREGAGERAERSGRTLINAGSAQRYRI